MAKTWFITGCSSGFGYEMAKLILQNDGRLIATSRNIESIKHWEDEFPERALIISMDVTNTVEVRQAIDEGLRKFKNIDIVINNAGYGITGAVEETSNEEFRAIFETNFFGILNVNRAILPHFRAQKTGTIVNFSSIAGIRGSSGLGAYSATKFAVEGMSEALADEVRPLGINVIIIEPGGFRTNWGAGSMKFSHDSIADYDITSGKVKQFFVSKNMQRTAMGNPSKLALAVIEIALIKNPPSRLALGEDCYNGISSKAKKLMADLEEFKSITLNTGF